MCPLEYLDFSGPDGLVGRVDEGVFFEAEGGLHGSFLGRTGEVDPDGGSGDGSMGLGQTELDHEPA